MAELVIKSRKTGENFSFWMNDNGGYIFLESPGRPGTLGHQICVGGQFTGSTLRASSESSFISVCRRWYRAYQKKRD